jgi:hypothetical protein
MRSLWSWTTILTCQSLVGTALAQVADPLPSVEKRGLTVEIRDVARLPETRGLRPPDQDVTPAGWARVSFVRDLPDGRRFTNDSRGFLYQLEGDQPSVYLDFAALFPFAAYNRLESGLIGFDFHPEFARNGLFYTVHGERAPGNPAVPNFVPPGFTAADATYHNVITEWRANDPKARTFSGTRRELLRVAHVVQNLTHPFGNVEFNPTAQPGSADYGLLYTSGSDPASATVVARTPSRPSCVSIRAARAKRTARKGSATTRFRRTTSSPPTATRRPWGKSTPMAFATPIGCRGT